MDTKKYYELFRYLMRQYCLIEEDIEFVEDIKKWSESHGFSEPDRQKPLKLVPLDASGCMMLVLEHIPEGVLQGRLNALRMRSQMIKSVTYDWADMLDTPQKILAYLFLHEYAKTLPQISDDELLADEWAIKEMQYLGYFKK